MAASPSPCPIRGRAVGQPWFFAETQGRIKYAEPQVTRRRDNMLIVETALADGAPQTGPVDGVLVVAPDVALQISATAGEVPSAGPISARRRRTALRRSASAASC